MKKSKVIGAVLIVALMATMTYAILTAYDQVANQVKIKAVGLTVTPESIVWDDFTEGISQTQSRILNITNMRNVDLTVTFSDDLAWNGLSMMYPGNFTLPALGSAQKNVTLSYNGSTPAWGTTTWTITVTGTEV